MKTPVLIRFHRAGVLLAAVGLAATLPLNAAAPTAICSPDGTHAASVDEASRILYSQADTGVVKCTYYACHVQALAFSEDSQLLAAGGGSTGHPGKIKVWRLQNSRQLCEITTATESITALALASDGSSVVSASAGGRLDAWRIADGTHQWTRTVSSETKSIEFTEDGRRLLVRLAQGPDRQLDPATGRNSVPQVTAKK